MSKCALVHSEFYLAQRKFLQVTKTLTDISDLKKGSKMKLEKALLTSEPTQKDGT